MHDDEDFEEDEAAAVSESDRAWREQTQRTNELAEELQPPHERGSDS